MALRLPAIEIGNMHTVNVSKCVCAGCSFDASRLSTHFRFSFLFVVVVAPRNFVRFQYLLNRIKQSCALYKYMCIKYICIFQNNISSAHSLTLVVYVHCTATAPSFAFSSLLLMSHVQCSCSNLAVICLCKTVEFEHWFCVSERVCMYLIE